MPGSDPYASLRARVLNPLRLVVASARRLPATPFFYRHRDLWEWESSHLGQLNQSPALFGHKYTWTLGGTAFRYEPSLIPASSADDFYSGLNFVFGNRLGMDLPLGRGANLSVRERAYVYSHKQAGSGTLDGFYANPLFENRVTATLEVAVRQGIVARLPFHLQQRLYMDCDGARYDGMLRNWIWVAPEIGFTTGKDSEVTVSYTTETLVSSRTGRWFIGDGFAEGVAEITYKTKL